MVGRLELTELTYCQEGGAVQYTFLADGVERKFAAIAIDEAGIRGVRLTSQCEKFLVSATIEVPRLMRAIVGLTLSHIDSAPLDLPIRLI
jgi:hypothetical protein